jgi:hypothetical protein
MTEHPLTAANIMDTPSNAMTRSLQNPYELILNEYDSCIYLNGSRFVSNYTIIDMRNRATAIIAPNTYYVVSADTQITMEPIDGVVNEFIIESTGPVTFTQNIIWQGQNSPNFQTGMVQYSITYNSVTQQYIGTWKLYDQPQLSTETWVFTLSDNSTVTKDIVVVPQSTP